jgi:G3E family GTPase
MHHKQRGYLASVSHGLTLFSSPGHVLPARQRVRSPLEKPRMRVKDVAWVSLTSWRSPQQQVHKLAGVVSTGRRQAERLSRRQQRGPSSTKSIHRVIVHIEAKAVAIAVLPFEKGSVNTSLASKP